MCQSKESDFVMVAGSTAGHLPLSPVDFSTAEFPALKGSDRGWLGCLHSAPPPFIWHFRLYYVGEVGTPTVFHPASSNCIFPSKFCAIIFLLPIMFWFMSKIFILCHILTKEDFWIVFGSCREHKYVVGRELSRYLPSKWFFLHYFFLFSSF